MEEKKRSLPAGVTIIENAWLASLACMAMKSKSVAMVWGNKILLWGVDRHEFLSNESWVRHELCHVEQFSRYGVPAFVAKYVWEWVRKGYRLNRFEVEARQAEQP